MVCYRARHGVRYSHRFAIGKGVPREPATNARRERVRAGCSHLLDCLHSFVNSGIAAYLWLLKMLLSNGLILALFDNHTNYVDVGHGSSSGVQ